MKHLLCFLPCTLSTPLFAEKPRMSFDADITGDAIDVLALAICPTLADHGACEFLSVAVSKNNPLTAGFVDAQNTFFCRPDLPVGVSRDDMAQHESKYLKLADSPVSPHDLKRNEEAKDSVESIHKLLSAQPDHSVTILSVGFASKMANLLKSPGGLDLLTQKVKMLSHDGRCVRILQGRQLSPRSQCYPWPQLHANRGRSVA